MSNHLRLVRVSMEIDPTREQPPFAHDGLIRVKVRMKAWGQQEYGLEQNEVIPVGDFDSRFSAIVGYMTERIERQFREIRENIAAEEAEVYPEDTVCGKPVGTTGAVCTKRPGHGGGCVTT